MRPTGVDIASTPLERLELRVYGQVQGVGFRPFVYRLANRLGLTGWVLNDGHGVQIQVQGAGKILERFVEGVRHGPARLSRVDAVEVAGIAPVPERDFRICESESEGISAEVAVDTCTCRECLGELFDPSNRRYRFPFTNCTDCGPRYTITRSLPYDRANTSMAAFTLCSRCEAEYRNPEDRRFHAEPNACWDCGPTLSLMDGGGEPVSTVDPVTATVERLLDGAIVAVKGLGGFHLACDGRNAVSVRRLRERKHRVAKPFAMMFCNVASTTEFVDGDEQVVAALESVERPIVLVPKRANCDRSFPGVAPDVGRLGVMLPYTPLHYLLFHEAAGRPEGLRWLGKRQELALTMTSANRKGEPLVMDNDEALDRLRPMADFYLIHNREIVERCDDSVLLSGTQNPVFVRRSRGYAPKSIPLPVSGPPVLAVGGWLKNTVCLTRDDRAYLSQHVGDLNSRASRLALVHAVEHLMAVLDLEPQCVARDLHPDYTSSGFADEFALARGLPVVEVQHHHAHVAAVIAESGMSGAVLGLALDGVGLGSDDTAWGGELLLVDETFRRLGHFAPLLLPGGDRAAREPWRMAASALQALGRGTEIEKRWPGESGRVVQQMLERQFNCPPTTSAGRLFDAAAGLLDVRRYSSYEAQAAMELEALAIRHGAVAPLDGGYRIDAAGNLEFWPLLERLADLKDPARGAALFHATIADGLAAWTRQTASSSGIDRIALAGGCMLNGVLVGRLRAALQSAGLRVYEARTLPPNDGALSYGQAYVAQTSRG